MAATPKPNEIKEEPIPLDLVHGQMPDSYNEYYVALALDKLNYSYSFQVPLGMSGVRGSQVIDFVVYNPNPVAVFVQGEYWHNKKTEMEDNLKHAAAARYYGAGNVIDFSEEETSTLEAAIRTVKAKL